MSRALLLGGIALGYYAYTSAKADTYDEGAVCPEGYRLSEEGDACLPLDDVGLVQDENPCPDGYKVSEDGTQCLSTAPDLNIHTGSDIGDFAANAAISMATGTAISGLIDIATRPRAANAAQAAAAAAKKKAADAAKAAAAKQAAAKAAQAAEKKAAAVAVAKAEMLAVKATKSAVIATKATKAMSLMSKALGGPGAVFSVLFTIIAQSLVALLDLRPGSFEACQNGEFDLSTLPNWAQAIIGGIPFAGDVFDLFSGVLCFHGGCDDPDSENQNGLCYKKPKPGFKCESFLCYKQYPEWENNGMLHTLLNITKAIKLDTGTIPDAAPPGSVKSGLLYYKDPGPDYNVVAGVAWQKCPPGTRDTGLRCEGDTYGNGIGKIRWNCNGDEERIAGLCYSKCRDGYHHIPGIGVTCTNSFNKNSFVIPPQTATCGSKKNIAGLCYTPDAEMPPGYSRKVIGTLDQTCPANSTDIGVACQRETYNRGVGKIPIRAYLKERTKQPVDVPPPTCAEAAALFSDPEKPQLCRDTICGEDETIEGDICVSKCRSDYTLSIVDGKRICTKGTDTYTLREPTPIVWGTF